jgi:hypothetical protein
LRSRYVHSPSSAHSFIFHDGVSVIPLLSLIVRVAIRRRELMRRLVPIKYSISYLMARRRRRK